MQEPFSAKLGLALKALSMSRGRLAADLGVDKSVVGRWVTGAVSPSAHNLTLITALVAKRVPGFSSLDWDRSLAGLAELLGADPDGLPGLSRPPAGLPIAILDQIHAMTALRGAAYEGIFRTTRPYIMQPGRFLHDHSMMRLDPTGLLRLTMGTGGTVVDGWALCLQNQIFCICADVTSGSMLVGIFNGVATSRADVMDGLSLGSALDGGRTPTATAMLIERVYDLSDDPAEDARRFAALVAQDPVAPEGSISEELSTHLARDIGPTPLATGGDWLLRMPLSRSLARGPAYGANAVRSR